MSNYYGYSNLIAALLFSWLLPWIPAWGSFATGMPMTLTAIAIYGTLLNEMVNGFVEDTAPDWFVNLVEKEQAKFTTEDKQ